MNQEASAENNIIINNQLEMKIFPFGGGGESLAFYGVLRMHDLDTVRTNICS